MTYLKQPCTIYLQVRCNKIGKPGESSYMVGIGAGRLALRRKKRTGNVARRRRIESGKATGEKSQSRVKNTRTQTHQGEKKSEQKEEEKRAEDDGKYSK